MLFGMIPAFAAEELVPAETAEIPAAEKTGEAPAVLGAMRDDFFSKTVGKIETMVVGRKHARVFLELFV